MAEVVGAALEKNVNKLLKKKAINKTFHLFINTTTKKRAVFSQKPLNIT